MSDIERDDAAEELVTDETRAAEEHETAVTGRADRAPTADEERTAEEVAEDVDPGVGEHFREMSEIGAEVEGEGRIGG